MCVCVHQRVCTTCPNAPEGIQLRPMASAIHTFTFACACDYSRFVLACGGSDDDDGNDVMIVLCGVTVKQRIRARDTRGGVFP